MTDTISKEKCADAIRKQWQARESKCLPAYLNMETLDTYDFADIAATVCLEIVNNSQDAMLEARKGCECQLSEKIKTLIPDGYILRIEYSADSLRLVKKGWVASLVSFLPPISGHHESSLTEAIKIAVNQAKKREQND